MSMKIKCRGCNIELDDRLIGAQWHWLWAHGKS